MPIYTNSNITRKVQGEIPAYRLVASAEGVITLAGADALPFGAVTEAGSDNADDKLPGYLRVHAGQAVVPVETADTGLKEGDIVYAAADGKVAKSGSVAVGVVDNPEHNKRGVTTVRVHLFKEATAG